MGFEWVSYIIYVCALFGLAASLLTNFMAVVRVVQAFGREKFLPPIFATPNPETGIPHKTCYITLVVLSLLAFFFDLEQLSLLISLDNLLVFSFVMTCSLSIRYENT